MKRWRGLGRLAFMNREAGYTITEVMVVLAVSTVMFVAIAATFQGRQARNEFTQGVRNFEAKLQSMTTEVANGVYQTGNCAAPPVGGRPSLSSANNGSCIFLGKALMPNGTSSNILTMIGRRTIGNPPVDTTTLAQAEGIISPSFETYNHSFQLRVVKIVRLSDNTTEVHALGLMNPLAGVDFESVGQDRQLYGLVTVSTFPGLEIDTDNYIPLPEGVVVCLAGQNNQRAEIRIGAASNPSELITELDTPNVTSGVCGSV